MITNRKELILDQRGEFGARAVNAGQSVATFENILEYLTRKGFALVPLEPTMEMKTASLYIHDAMQKGIEAGNILKGAE